MDGWLYAWGLVVTFSVVMSFIAPVLLFPLFNKFDPLTDEDLNEKIQSYAKDQNFSLKGIFQMDGSKRSNKLNAFFTGFGKYRRIVLFDTLLEKLDHDEIIAVIAHEMGHYKKKHLYSGLLISTLSSFVMFYVLSIFISDQALFSVFGIQEVSVYAGECSSPFYIHRLKWFYRSLATFYQENMNTRQTPVRRLRPALLKS